MKSFTVFAVALVVSLVVLTGTTQADLITNGTFDTGLSGWTTSAPYPTSGMGWDSGQFANLKYGSSSATAGWLSQTIGTLSAGKEYTVSYDARAEGGTPMVFAGLYYDNGTVWAPLGSSPYTQTLSGGDFQTYGFSFDTLAGQPYNGAALQFKIGAADAGGDANAAWSDVDNISVTVAPTPEPGVLVLLGTGLISLLCYAWRKRG